MRVRCRQEYSGVRGDWYLLSVDDQRAAALGAVEYLRIRVALRAYYMILTVLLTHVEQVQREFLFGLQDRVITEKQKITSDIHIVTK